MMEVKTFRAGTLQEALQLVRHSLGPDAAVLTTRNLRVNRLGLFPKNMIEVEASVDAPLGTSRPAESRPAIADGVASDETDTQAHEHFEENAEGETVQAGELPRERGGHMLADSPPSARHERILPPRTALREQPLASMVERADSPLARRQSHKTSAVITVLTELLSVGVEPAYAKALLALTTEQMPADFIDDAWKIRQQLTRVVMGRLECSGALKLAPGSRSVVAFVGPTGSGKTSTLAKLAAGVRFEMGSQIGLITVDTFRLGAVDQLLQYAELMSAQLEVVSSVDQLPSALERLAECDLVMLDTAGRSHRDVEQLELLREMIQAANPDSVQLVVSATCARAQVYDTIARFSDVGPTELLITKLDEAVAFGEWMSVLCELPLPVSYLTTGQHVPQDIVAANPRRLASALLGNEHAVAENSQHFTAVTS